jgi:Na+-translocating ferredoxin:NAD+ oxidoreductase subunit D
VTQELRRPLEIATAPFVHTAKSTSKVMVEVLLATLPVVAAATYYFGITALLLVAVTCAGAALTEALFDARRFAALRDGSALLTGVLLALTLPPAIPLWMAFLGGVIAIVLGKVIWGGLGRNLFNPALVGRAFLQAAFPVTLTTWVAPGRGLFHVEPSTYAAPLMKPAVDVVTSASPLGLAKFEHQLTDVMPLLLGRTAGSLGETAGLLLIAIGIWLAVRRIFDWRLTVSTLLSVAVFSALLHFAAADKFPSPWFMLGSGGLLFGAVFMVTDPVTTPITPRGAWIFGIGVGVLVVLIRIWGGLPEGVMYAILLMNSVTPLIDRKTQPRRFGG